MNLRLMVLHARTLQHHVAEHKEKRLSEIIKSVYNVDVPPHVIANEARQYDLDNRASGYAGYLPTDDPFTRPEQLEGYIEQMEAALTRDDYDEDDDQ